MGRVLRVWDEDLQRELAMKVVPVDALDPENRNLRAHRLLERFLDEARITGQLNHSGIIPVHEIAFDEEGSLYFTMPLVRGETLKRVIELTRTGEQGWTLQRAIGVLHQVSLTVGFAHSEGVVHRDLKPENIMVGNFGEAYVLDWGLALVLGSSETGTVVGTPAYMPPEQALGKIEEVGPSSDIYSIGAILYELLGGRVPHEASLEEARGSGALDQDAFNELLARPPRPLEPSRNAPPELLAISRKAMAPDLSERYEDLVDMAEDLKAWLEGRVVTAYETGSWARIRKWSERNRGLTRALQTIALLLVVGLAGFAFQQRSQRRQYEASNRDLAQATYSANLSAADRALGAHESMDAQARLRSCPEVLRNWEWAHLALRAEGHTLMRELQGGFPTSLVPRLDGSTVIIGTNDGRLSLLGLQSDPLREWKAHAERINDLLISPQGDRVISASSDSKIKLWSVADGTLLRTFEEHQSAVLALDRVG